jgi:hypothetical protein
MQPTPPDCDLPIAACAVGVRLLCRGEPSPPQAGIPETHDVEHAGLFAPAFASARIVHKKRATLNADNIASSGDIA